LAQVHAINSAKGAIKAIKLPVAWSLNCLHVIVCVALRCQLTWVNTKDLTLKAKATRTQNLSSRTSQDQGPKTKDNNTAKTYYQRRARPVTHAQETCMKIWRKFITRTTGRSITLRGSCHVPGSFCPGIELCSIACKKLVPEKYKIDRPVSGTSLKFLKCVSPALGWVMAMSHSSTVSK